MTRIRYNTSGLGEALDSHHLLAGSQFVYVRLFPTTSPPTFKVFNAANDSVITSGQANSLVAVKKAAKRAVVGLGAVFDAERRTLLPMDGIVLGDKPNKVSGGQ